MEAYQDLLNATSTEEAPWYVIPAGGLLDVVGRLEDVV
jgi:polyphosphate kinase 2 (PPK2 family)